MRGYLRKALLVIIFLGAGIGILHWQLLEKQRLGFPGRRSFSRADFPPAAAVWTRANPVDPVSPALEALEPQAAPEALETREYPTPEESVVISEINYHPPGGDRREEWIELLNRSKKAVDMTGWKLTGHGKGRPSGAGIHFTFPEGTVLEPGKLLVVCADRARLAPALAPEMLLGDWEGSLDRGGEKLLLASKTGAEVDSVVYSDHPPFPTLPDGLGRSLERRSPHETSDLPNNWGSSRASAGGWMRFQTTGILSSRRLYFYLLGPGTAYVDDVTLRLASGGPEVWREDFEGREGSWSSSGNHGESHVGAERVHSGARSLKVVASGSGSGRGASVYCDVPSVRQGEGYELEFWALFLPPQAPLVARFSSAGTGTSGLSVQASPGGASSSATPGKVNSINSRLLPPLIFPVTHAPERPAPDDVVTIRAQIRPAAGVKLKSATLHLNDGRGEKTLPLWDDGNGEHGDTQSGDGIWCSRLGPYPAGTLGFFRVTAEDEKGVTASFPLEESPTKSLGFFVEAREAGPGDIPEYHLFLSSFSLQDLDRNPFSDAYRPGVFVHDGRVYADVGLRYRGETSRGAPKHHWKVKFQKDNPFVPWPGHREVSCLDLNSSFGDKTYLRELLSYNLWRDLGEGTSEAWHARMSLNGEYLGFYVNVENPGDEYLARNRLEKGWLWKAYSEGYQGSRGFQLKTGEPEAGRRLLDEFLRNMRSLEGEALESYIRDHMLVDSLLNFLVACQLIHSADHVQKNYLVYGSKEGKFTFLPWDTDLTHGRNFECAGGGVWNDEIRYDMWDREFRDQKLLFGTQAHRKCDGWVNVVIDGFLRRASTFRPLFYQRLAEGLAHYYHPDVLIPKVRRLHDRIRKEAEEDRARWRSYGGDDDFDRNCAELERWVQKRFDYLKAKLKGLGYEVGPPLNADFDAGARWGFPPLKVEFQNLSAGKFEASEWDFGDGERSSDKEPFHVFTKPGRYDVTLRVRGPSGTHTAARKDFVVVRK